LTKETVESKLACVVDWLTQTPGQFIDSTENRAEESPSDAIDNTGMAVPNATDSTGVSGESSSDEHTNTGKYDCTQSPSVAAYSCRSHDFNPIKY
jgi:hypothetical protein